MGMYREKQPLTRSTFEAYGGIGVAVVMGIVSMTFWLKAFLLVGLWGLSVDVILNSPLSINFSPGRKIFLCALSAVLIGAVFYRPMLETYYEDHAQSKEREFINLVNDAIGGEENKKQAAELVARQYQSLLFGTTVFEQNTGRIDYLQRLATQDYIIQEMRLVAETRDVKAFNKNGALYMQVSPNIFHVTFSVPMRASPTITVLDFPAGSHATLVRENNLGFVVEFDPSTISVQDFNFTADAEIYGR